MTISERVSYIKGLAEGLELGESKEEKLIKEIIGILDDVALAIEDIDNTCAEIGEQVDAVDEDLAAVEDYLLDEDDDCDCCESDCDCDDECYEIECPACNETLYLDEEMLEEDGIVCPNCGTDLEFDFDCDCGCEDCEIDKE